MRGGKASRAGHYGINTGGFCKEPCVARGGPAARRGPRAAFGRGFAETRDECALRGRFERFVVKAEKFQRIVTPEPFARFPLHPFTDKPPYVISRTPGKETDAAFHNAGGRNRGRPVTRRPSRLRLRRGDYE